MERKSATSHNRLGFKGEVVIAYVVIAAIGIWGICLGAPGLPQ